MRPYSFLRVSCLALLGSVLTCSADDVARFSAVPTFADDFSADWVPGANHWQVATWNQNETQMSPERCAVDASGNMVQTVLPGLPGRGGSMQTDREFGYGRWTARVKPSAEPGLLNSIFTKDWDNLETAQPHDGLKSEVDIEFLSHTFGPGRGDVHLAIHLVIDGRDVSEAWDIPLDFNPSDDFHDWGFDILPEGVIWHVDGRELHRWKATPESKIDPAYEFFFNSWTMSEWIKGPPSKPGHYLIDRVTFQPLETFTVQPMPTPGLGVRLGAETLPVDAPETLVLTTESKPGEPLANAPDDLASERWPGALGLTPRFDTAHTHILGSLFRGFRPNTLRVESLDGSQHFRRDVDYRFREETGLVANLNGRITGPIRASVTVTLQRLDLLQRDPHGRLSIKKGASSLVCPELPAPDANQIAIAGIYVAPWTVADNPFLKANALTPAQDEAADYAVTAHAIFPIAPKPPVMPANPERLGTVLGKLRSGEPVKVAFMGDSITLGAESTRWWNDNYDANSQTWKGRVVHTLRQRFPKSKIEVIEAYRGGVTIDYGLERIDEVLSAKPDLIIASFGVNDAAPRVGKRTSEQFGEAMATLLDKSKAAGADTLWVVPFPLSPWMNSPQATVLDDQLIPVMRRTAAAHGAALADVNTAFRDLDSRGIPWWSQHHNWHNHPGNLGHAVYAETVLNCFPK